MKTPSNGPRDNIAPQPKQAAARSWRDALKIHPAADEFELMNHDELVALGEDIKARGLVNPIVYTWADDAGLRAAPCRLLDGRSRLDAMEAVGLEVELKVDRGGRLLMSVAGLHEGADCVPEPILRPGDPYDQAISLNIHRRHLTPDQKRELITKIIARAPEKSDRQIAIEICVDHKTVGTARAKGEDVGRIPHVETRVDTRGRRQPGSKPATGRGGAARPRSPRPVTRRRPAVAPLNSLSWSEASKEERERFVSNVGFESLWSHAPPEFRELARAELLATPPAPAGEIANDLIGAAKDDPMAIPAALKRTPPTDRFGRPRPEPGSLLKGAKK
jgi:hypothetical protein